MAAADGPDPGLDITALRAVRGRRLDSTAVLAQIVDYRDRHDSMWVAWSGGKGSTVVVDLARRVDPDVPVVFSWTSPKPAPTLPVSPTHGI